MMTASSLEFFPCRVQLMGLPRSAGAPGNGVTTPRLNRNVTAPPNEPRSSPPMAKLHAISRNLFGTPDPMEMNHLYQEETQRQRSYVMQRYNIDIETEKPTGNSKPVQQQQQQRQPQQQQHQSLQPTETAVGTFAMPTLIEQELQQHEQRLQKEKCNLIRAAGATASAKQMAKGCNSDANIHQQPHGNLSGAKKVRSRSIVAITTNNNHNNNNNCCKDMSVPLAAERYKPYERQTLITDCYSLRKNKSYVMSVNGNKTTTMTTVKGKNNQKMLLLSSPCSTSSSSQFSASVSSSSSSSPLSSSLQQNLEVLKATAVGGGQQPADIYLKLTNDDKTINGDNERNNNNNNNNYYDDNNSNTNNNHNDNDNNVVDIYKNNRIIRKDDDDDECAVVGAAAAAAATTAPTTTVTVNDTTITSTDLILKVSVTAPPKVTVNDNQCNNTITAPKTQNQA